MAGKSLGHFIVVSIFVSKDTNNNSEDYLLRVIYTRRQYSKSVGSLHNMIVEKLYDLYIYGPLPTSRGGVTQLVVVIEGSSKLFRQYPLKKLWAIMIFSCIVEYRTWIEILCLLENTLIHTSAYFPQGNMTERTNREVGGVSRTFYNVKHFSCAVNIKEVDRCINNSIHETTDVSLNELHFSITSIVMLLARETFISKAVDLGVLLSDLTNPRNSHSCFKFLGAQNFRIAGTQVVLIVIKLSRNLNTVDGK